MKTYNRGAKNQNVKITTKQVLEIRFRRTDEQRTYPGNSLKELAKEFGVAPSCISQIATRDRWGYVDEET